LSACIRLLTSVRAAVTRASSARSSMLGTISAASTPMITSTTISSIRVKPRLRRRRFITGPIVDFYRSSASMAGVVDHNRRMFARLSAFVIWSLVAAAMVFWALRFGVSSPQAPAFAVPIDRARRRAATSPAFSARRRSSPWRKRRGPRRRRAFASSA
jgi:hypothetical protein